MIPLCKVGEARDKWETVALKAAAVSEGSLNERHLVTFCQCSRVTHMWLMASHILLADGQDSY